MAEAAPRCAHLLRGGELEDGLHGAKDLLPSDRHVLCHVSKHGGLDLRGGMGGSQPVWEGLDYAGEVTASQIHSAIAGGQPGTARSGAAARGQRRAHKVALVAVALAAAHQARALALADGHQLQDLRRTGMRERRPGSAGFGRSSRCDAAVLATPSRQRQAKQQHLAWKTYCTIAWDRAPAVAPCPTGPGRSGGPAPCHPRTGRPPRGAAHAPSPWPQTRRRCLVADKAGGGRVGGWGKGGWGWGWGVRSCAWCVCAWMILARAGGICGVAQSCRRASSSPARNLQRPASPPSAALTRVHVGAGARSAALAVVEEAGKVGLLHRLVDVHRLVNLGGGVGPGMGWVGE